MSIITVLVHFLLPTLHFFISRFLQLHVPYLGLLLRLVHRNKCLYAGHIIGAISGARKDWTVLCLEFDRFHLTLHHDLTQKDFFRVLYFRPLSQIPSPIPLPQPDVATTWLGHMTNDNDSNLVLLAEGIDIDHRQHGIWSECNGQNTNDWNGTELCLWG